MSDQPTRMERLEELQRRHQEAVSDANQRLAAIGRPPDTTDAEYSKLLGRALQCGMDLGEETVAALPDLLTAAHALEMLIVEYEEAAHSEYDGTNKLEDALRPAVAARAKLRPLLEAPDA